MDDTFILKDKNSSLFALDLLNWINPLDKNLKFTFENENNDRLNFLDVFVIRNGDIWNYGF